MAIGGSTRRRGRASLALLWGFGLVVTTGAAEVADVAAPGAAGVEAAAATQAIAVRCTHSPLWPQPGQNVTITVESLTGAVQVGDTVKDLSAGAPGPPLVNRQKIADRLEIWVGDQNGPDLVLTDRSVGTFTVNSLPAGDLVYGCVARSGTENAFTGWRRSRVGPPATGKGIPVIYTGERATRIDIVFIADLDSYSSATDPRFLAAAANVIKGAYFGQNYFLANQHYFNFWLADQMGDADRTTSCVLRVPSNWATDYAWRDSGAILHSDTFRDCASNGVFSTEPTSLGTVLHETGHSPFGLADEYCCDGGYWEPTVYPNMHNTLAECQADAPRLGRAASACRRIADTRYNPVRNWYLSEPTPNDIMSFDRHPPQAADIRRIDWYFDNCEAQRC